MSKKNLFPNIFLGLGFLFLCYSSVFANVDISLEDNTESKEISIIVNSNDEYVDGIALSVVTSEDVTIDEENLPESLDACTLSGRVYSSGNTIYLECFNDSGTVMNGTVVTIPYSTESTDYYFYVDTSSLDLGAQEFGTISNINYSDAQIDELTSEENEEADIEEESFFNKVINFISDNFLYVIGGAVLLVIAIVLIMTLSKPKEESSVVETVQESPEQNTTEQTTEQQPVEQPKEENIS